VKFGFCRGLEPVNYVSHILERFEHYKQYLTAHRDDLAPSESQTYHVACAFNLRPVEMSAHMALPSPSLSK
jgi:hypothetical protein